MAWDELVAAGAQDRGRLPGHAGTFETSLTLALRPELVVDPPRRPGTPYRRNPAGYFSRYHVEEPDAMARGEGFSDDPSAGTADDGRRYLAAVVAAVASCLQEFAG